MLIVEGNILRMHEYHSIWKSLERFLPKVLLFLAIWDLRIEIRLLLDHFTFTALIFALRDHILAVIVLLASPSIWRRYKISLRVNSSK